jgi:mono/diheme cytochrome c family protein
MFQIPKAGEVVLPKLKGVMTMKRAVIAVIGVAFLSGAPAFAQDAKKIADGKKIYDAKECSKCHMIAGKGNKIGPLDSGHGLEVGEADMRKWLTDPAAMEQTLDHKPKVKMSSKAKAMDLKPADIDALVAYLVSVQAGKPKQK